MNTGFLFCVCPDAALLKDTVNAFFASEGYASSDKLVFWGDEGLSPRFWEALTLQGLVSAHKCLTVRNAQLLPAETWKALSKSLGHPHEQALPVFCLEGPWEKGRPKLPAWLEKLSCTAFARKKRWWKEIPGLSPSSLRDRLRAKASELGISIAPNILEQVARVLPLDASAVDSEMAKLALYAAATAAPGTRPTLDSGAAALVSHTPEFNIFELLKHMQRGENSAAWDMLSSQQADIIFALLGLLQREARLLWQTLTNEAQPRDAGPRKFLASQLGFSGLIKLWDAMHEASLSIKSGRKQDSQALDELIAQVSLLFRPRR